MWAINAVLIFAREVYFDEVSDEELEIQEKNENYAEVTVPFFTDNQFKRHFRLTPTTFETLLVKIHNCRELNRRRNNNINVGGGPKTPLEKELMITVWCLGNLESFRSVADRFGISKSTCWDILYRTCRILLQVNDKFKVIAWPNEERQTQIANSFSAYNFPGVIGCIDGSHIRIVAPKENPNSYVNRKGFHSLLLQGVCDDKMLFTSVYTGQVGSLHDENLFQKSDLCQAIDQRQVIFYNDTHLIGDLAYTLRTNLIVGFKDNGHLTERQKNFNVVLSKKRVKIENAFALLKGRFRRLKFLETVRIDLAVLLIFSGCILHNVCLLEGDFVEGNIDIEEERQLEFRNNPNNLPDDDPVVIARNAIIKRNNIMHNVCIIRQ